MWHVCTDKSFWAINAKPRHTRWITGQDTSAEMYQWPGKRLSAKTQKHQKLFYLAEHEFMLLYCCQPLVHKHTSLRIQQYCTHINRHSMGPLIISNPVLLLVPHSSVVLLALGWLCSLCIYLSVVQRLHAVEIKSKTQRAGRGLYCWTQQVPYVYIPFLVNISKSKPVKSCLLNLTKCKHLIHL